MEGPELDRDNWCLEDGEERHRAAPATFEIPDLAVRTILQAGDFAQLIFKIAIYDDDDDDPYSFERMWVIVRERIPGGYMGMLNNQPATIGNTDPLHPGNRSG